jgi:DNA polymerase-4
VSSPEPPAERRVIAHIDADAFYASVHLLEDPTLAGKPVIVAGTGLRSIVTTASYEARAYGIGSAMPATQARRLCPHGIFLRPDFDLYRDYSRRAMAIIERHVSQVEPLSLDEAYLDITELDNPVRMMRELIAEIERETGLRYSVGIGPNKLCAKVLSDHRKPRAFNVASREQCCELFAQSPPRLIPGIGPKTAETLERMGLATIEAVRAAPIEQLADAFGARRGLELQARTRFEHEGRVHRDRELKSKSEERTFEHDVRELDELDSRLRELAVDLAEQLQRRTLRGRTIGIKVRLADFTTVTRARTLEEPTNDIDVVADVASALLREYAPEDPVRLIGVRVAGFEQPEQDEPDLEDVDAARPGQQLQLPIRQALAAAAASAAGVSGDEPGIDVPAPEDPEPPMKDETEDILLQPSTREVSSLDRGQAVELTRRQLDDSFRASDEEIWATWQRVRSGPTVRDDLGRVIAHLEGIALDG